MSESIHDFDTLELYDKKNINWFIVNWCLGNTCNFECSYCPDYLHNGTKKWHTVDNIKAVVNKIKKYHPEKKIYFEFTGGEVSLYKEFIPICQVCMDNDVKVGFITNGSRTLRWWEENKHYFDHVMMSFHSEFADPEHFCKVVEILHFENRTHCNIMMNPDPDLFDMCVGVANRIRGMGNVSIALQPLIHDLAGELYDYTPDQQYVIDNQFDLITKRIKWTKTFDNYRGNMRAIRADGSEHPKSVAPHLFINKNTNNWFGWDCHVGVEQMVVDMDGSVYRGWCKVGNSIGNINDVNLVLPTKSIVCDKTLCHCNFDIMSTKKRLPGGV